MTTKSKRNLFQGLFLALTLFSTVLLAEPEFTEPVDFALERLGDGPVALSDYRGGWVGQ